MSNVIQFLESQGSTPFIINISDKNYIDEVASLELNDDQRRALLARDAVTINRLLDGREKMMCLIWKHDEESEPGQTEEKESEVPAEDAPEENS